MIGWMDFFNECKSNDHTKTTKMLIELKADVNSWNEINNWMKWSTNWIGKWQDGWTSLMRWLVHWLWMKQHQTVHFGSSIEMNGIKRNKQEAHLSFLIVHNSNKLVKKTKQMNKAESKSLLFVSYSFESTSSKWLLLFFSVLF